MGELVFHKHSLFHCVFKSHLVRFDKSVDCITKRVCFTNQLQSLITEWGKITAGNLHFFPVIPTLAKANQVNEPQPNCFQPLFVHNWKHLQT